MTIREGIELAAEALGFIMVCGSLGLIIVVALLLNGSI